MSPQPTSNTSAQSDRRQFHRRQFQGTLEIEWGSAKLSATVRDIGPSGLFAELLPPLWLGATFRAYLIVNPVLQLNCTVRRIEPSKGMGLSFEVSEESGKAQLEALLAALPEI